MNTQVPPGVLGGRRLARRWKCVIALFLAAICSSVISWATPTHGPDQPAVAVISPTHNVTISWKVRAVRTVGLRLYRFGMDGRAILVSETVAERGESSFEFVDSQRPTGDTVYHLRVVNRRGGEKTLASVLCVEYQFTPGSIPAPSASGDQPGWTERMVDSSRLESSGLVLDEAVFESGWIPALEPPVPRTV